jgi:hypothetical protein
MERRVPRLARSATGRRFTCVQNTCRARSRLIVRTEHTVKRSFWRRPPSGTDAPSKTEEQVGSSQARIITGSVARAALTLEMRVFVADSMPPLRVVLVTRKTRGGCSVGLGVRSARLFVVATARSPLLGRLGSARHVAALDADLGRNPI